jgi:hypothetical protein
VRRVQRPQRRRGTLALTRGEVVSPGRTRFVIT